MGLYVALAWIVWSGGCGTGAGPTDQPGPQPAERPKPVGQAAVSYAGYAIAAIQILPLTEFNQSGRLDAYLSVLDLFGSQLKAPFEVRFELYEHLERSAEPKGKRVVLWPDFDLSDGVANHKYWRDHLRAYEFALEAEEVEPGNYILEATCTPAREKRLTAETLVRLGPQSTR